MSPPSSQINEALKTRSLPAVPTGSRGDVFVVRTSKPVEIMGYFDRVDDRVTVSLQILYTANQETEGSQDRLTV